MPLFKEDENEILYLYESEIIALANYMGSRGLKDPNLTESERVKLKGIWELIKHRSMFRNVVEL